MLLRFIKSGRFQRHNSISQRIFIFQSLVKYVKYSKFQNLRNKNAVILKNFIKTLKSVVKII